MSVNDLVRHSYSKVIFEDHVEVGYNYRLTDIQAAIGIKQLEKLDWLISERKKIAEKYHEAFKTIRGIRLPHEKEGYKSNYQSYSIYIKHDSGVSRNDLMQAMLEKGIATRRGVMCTHRESAYKEEYKNVKLPVSEDLQDNSIIIPLFIPMTNEDVDTVTREFKSHFNYDLEYI